MRKHLKRSGFGTKQALLCRRFAALSLFRHYGNKRKTVAIPSFLTSLTRRTKDKQSCLSFFVQRLECGKSQGENQAGFFCGGDADNKKLPSREFFVLFVVRADGEVRFVSSRDGGYLLQCFFVRCFVFEGFYRKNDQENHKPQNRYAQQESCNDASYYENHEYGVVDGFHSLRTVRRAYL